MGVCAPQEVGEHVLNTALTVPACGYQTYPFAFLLQEPIPGRGSGGLSLQPHHAHRLTTKQG